MRPCDQIDLGSGPRTRESLLLNIRVGWIILVDDQAFAQTGYHADDGQGRRSQRGQAHIEAWQSDRP